MENTKCISSSIYTSLREDDERICKNLQTNTIVMLDYWCVHFVLLNSVHKYKKNILMY